MKCLRCTRDFKIICWLQQLLHICTDITSFSGFNVHVFVAVDVVVVVIIGGSGGGGNGDMTIQN